MQDGFLLQPFEKEDRAAPDQAEKDDSCNKVDKPEKTPKKMLSRGEECYSTCSGVLVLDLLQIDFFFFPSLYYLDNLPSLPFLFTCSSSLKGRCVVLGNKFELGVIVIDYVNEVIIQTQIFTFPYLNR